LVRFVELVRSTRPKSGSGSRDEKQTVIVDIDVHQTVFLRKIYIKMSH